MRGRPQQAQQRPASAENIIGVAVGAATQPVPVHILRGDDHVGKIVIPIVAAERLDLELGKALGGRSDGNAMGSGGGTAAKTGVGGGIGPVRMHIGQGIDDRLVGDRFPGQPQIEQQMPGFINIIPGADAHVTGAAKVRARGRALDVGVPLGKAG